VSLSVKWTIFLRRNKSIEENLLKSIQATAKTNAFAITILMNNYNDNTSKMIEIILKSLSNNF